MKTALFPGSFDPITLAHIDLIERATLIFDKVHVCIGINSSKKNLLSVDQRLEIIRKHFQGNTHIEVSTYTGLTVDYARKLKAQAIVRGLRSVQDLEYERPIAQNNLQLNAQVETLFLISRPEFTHISSTIVREIHQYGGALDHLVPKTVLQTLSSM